MGRSLTTAQLQALFSQSTSKVFLALLDLDHSSFASGNYRFVNNTESITSNGTVYTPFPFAIVLPDDNENNGPRGRLAVGNVDRTIIDDLRSMGGSERIKVTIQIIMSDEPDTPLATYNNFELRNVDYDAFTVTGDLSLVDFLGEPFPSDRFTPNLFRGLF